MGYLGMTISFKTFETFETFGFSCGEVGIVKVGE
jgi:hypothetical protein